MNNTLNYYNNHTNNFINETLSVDFQETQNKFSDKLSSKAKILDFGCGSGRDTKYFMEQGFQVDAIDGSYNLCQKASEYTGITVQCMMFQELNALEVYDGIWACASILHLAKKELKLVIGKIIQALKVNGVIYTSFKYGDFEGERNGRYFTDFTVESFQEYVDELEGIEIEEYWITSDVRPNRGEEKWLNVILRKK